MQHTLIHSIRGRVLAVCAVLLATASTSLANPGGITPGSKLVYSFNLIGYPADHPYTGGCGNGHRLFVNRDAHGAQVLIQNSDSGWDILDCNATEDHRAVLGTNEVGVFDIYVRILGKPGGNINICGDTLQDVLSGETLCQIGTIDLTRSKGASKFQIAPSAMFDASLIDVIWTVDTNPDFRIAQFRVYARP